MGQTTPQIDHAIVDVLIVNEDKFLLAEEGKLGREGLFNLPGGHIEASETLFDAAIREVKEETGYFLLILLPATITQVGTETYLALPFTV